MIKQVQVFYRGWGEHWLWGTLLESITASGRPQISFEYSDAAVQRGLELSAYRLPLQGAKLRQDFPAHQHGLPGPVYDALPDGWGMLLMDRLFKRQGLDAVRVGALQRLCHIGDNAMGALSFQPVLDGELEQQSVSLLALAQQVEEVQQGDRVTTLVDYYGFQHRQGRTSQQIVQAIHEGVAQQIKNYDEQRVLPYLQMHEFEGLLFSEPDAFEWVTDGWNKNTREQLHAISSIFANPEDINDSPETAPSKRILKIFPPGAYSKVEHGPLIAEEIGIESMRIKCPLFNGWVNKLENWSN